MNDLSTHSLHAIVDLQVAANAGWKALDLGRAFLDGGARVLQLRAKELASGAFLGIAEALITMADEYDAGVIVNDRVDIARLCHAEGVHVGQDDLPPSVAREQLGPTAIVGYSTHSVEQVEAALREPVSYVAVGPVFGTSTKNTGYSAVGLELVSAAARRGGSRPIVAIGGVTLANTRSAIEAGATAVAVISDLLIGDPTERVKAFLRVLE